MPSDEPIYTHLEITLARATDRGLQVELRYDDPTSDSEIPPVRGGTRLDLDALQAALLDPEAYGRLLGEALFPDALREHYRRVETATEASGAFLRLCLRLDPSTADLHALRWELLRDPSSGAALATSERRLFSRLLASHDWQPVKLRPKAVLTALIAVSAPTDLERFGLAEVDAAGEVERARTALGGVGVEVVGLDAPLTLDTLGEALRGGVDLLYLVCHGALSRRSGTPVLYLQDADGSTAPARGAAFAERLAELACPPRLAVLASCESAGTGDPAGKALAGETAAQAALAPRLAESGVAAVLAMQGKISIETVEEMMPAFFAALLEDGRLDRALAVARGRVRERPDAWMPALSTRLKSGRLWYVPGFTGLDDETVKWQALVDDLRSGDCVPILGPNFGEHLFGSVQERARELAMRYGFPMQAHQRVELAKVTQFLSVRYRRNKARREVIDQLRDRLREAMPGEEDEDGKLFSAAARCCYTEPLDPFRILADLPARVYVTAGFDPVLPATLAAAGRPPKVLFCKWRRTLDHHPKQPPYAGKPTAETPVVFHAFGVAKKDAFDSLVLTEDDHLDYLIAATEHRLIPTEVRGALVKSSLLFLGFPLDDLAFRLLFRLILSLEGSPGLADHPHVGVQVDPETYDLADVQRARAYLEEYYQTGAGAPPVDIYWGSAAEFLRDLHQHLNVLPTEAAELEEVEDDEWVF